MGYLFLYKEAKPKVYNSINYLTLIQIRYLRGRGSITIIRRSLSLDTLYIFKGINFGVFLESPTDFRYQKDIYYYKIRIIYLLPRYLNIIPPLSLFITARRVEDQRQVFIYSTLYPFIEYSILDNQVKKSKTTRIRLVLINKVVQCFQIALAIFHAYFTVYIFYIDIKLANFLLDTNKDLIFIDQEQSGALLYTLVPKANGSQDIKESRTGSLVYNRVDLVALKLIYRKYRGPY